MAIAVVVLAVLAWMPSAAAAHGPVNPSASSFLARISEAPAGVHAQAVDGDQRLWLDVAPSRTVVVLDYRGAPYLRFSQSGVAVNHNSSMYYLNQVPAEIPPAALGPETSPKWSSVSTGHSYEWHDGRLHALATTVVAGRTYLGRWTVAVRVDGRPAVIAGGLYYAPDVSLVWFWPIVVVLASVLAALRMHRPRLDWALARALALAAAIAVAVAVVGRQLHGRPSVTIAQLVVLAVELALVGWALLRLARGRHGWFMFFVIGVASIYEGATLVTVLVRGFVLIALPATLARAAVCACLACGAGLVPVVFRIAPTPERAPEGEDQDVGEELGLEDEGLVA